MGVLGNLSSIHICSNLSPILLSQIRVFQIVDIIPHCQDKLVGNKPLVYQVQSQHIRHFPD